MEALEGPTTPPARVPRRTPKACKQCRNAKIKCSGTRPCARCTRRRDNCVFPTGEPLVAVPERYLLDLQRRAAQSSQTRVPSSEPVSGVTANEAPQAVETEPQASHSAASSTAAAHAALSEPPEQISSSASSSHPENGPAGQDIPPPYNPLIARNLAFILDCCGRMRYLGPTSTWSFCRRVLFLLEGQTPSSNGSSAPLNLDGTAFRLSWQSKPTADHDDLKGIPASDYTMYLYNTVKFHLGELFGVVDEASFMAHFAQFHKDPLGTAQSNKAWFCEFLLILAFGKGFLASSGSSAAAIPGSEFAARAAALLPDPQQMHDEHVNAIELVTLLALYFQSIDMRATAYQFIGQAVRLAFMEGIHLQVSTEVVSEEFSRRCNNVWWIVYVVDQELTAAMGGAPMVPEGAVTAMLPSECSLSLPAKALTLRVHLSKLLATICSTVYGLKEGLDTSFVRTTTTVLYQLAEVSRELDQSVSDINGGSKSEWPHMFRHVALSYHHCIVLATRPLVMWLLLLNMPPASVEAHQLSGPLSALLQTCVESATTVLRMLRNLAENDLLETFLPFQLDYAFSAAMILSILGTILPSYIHDSSWSRNVRFVLEEIIRAKNMFARFRLSELDTLDLLLLPLRKDGSPNNVPDDNPLDGMTEMSNDKDPRGDAAPMSTRGGDSATAPGQLQPETDPFGYPWDLDDFGSLLGTNPDQILELAEQLESGDIPSVLFDLNL